MKKIINSFKREKEYVRLLNDRHGKRHISLVNGLSGMAEAVFIGALCDDLADKLICIVCGDESSAAEMKNLLSQIRDDVYFYPARELCLGEFDGASHDWEQIRISSLFAVLSGKCKVLVTTSEALMQPCIPPEVLKKSAVTLKYGEISDFDALVRFLSEVGYAKCDMVESRSQYAVRGGIVDLFPPLASAPVRVEFFGDEVDSISEFDPIDQRRKDSINEITVTPCRELILDPEARKRVSDHISKKIDENSERLEKVKAKVHKEKKKNPSEEKMAELLSGISSVERSAEMLKKAKAACDEAMDFSTADIYIRLIYGKNFCLADYFPKETSVYIRDLKAVKNSAAAYEYRISEAVDSVLEKGLVDGEFASYCEKADFVSECLELFGGFVQNNLSSSVGELKFDGLYGFNVKHGAQGGYNFELLCDDIRHYSKNGYSVYLAASNETAKKGLAEFLSERGIKAYSDSIYEAKSGEVCVICGRIGTGFELPSSKIVLMCDVRSQTEGVSKPKNAILKAQQKEIAAKYKNSTQKIISYADLAPGDHVVHASYGIGVFCGIETMSDKGVTKDYIKIKYAGTDVLFVPVAQLDMVSKYIGAGSDDVKLKLSKLSGSDWSKAKAAVKKQVKDMAEKLVKLYAERKNCKGFAFSPDTEWQDEFESGFEYTETDGQIAAISEIKADMESDAPMDRLLCGDVGFGKTEVALRAAFKAVCDGKQVAILVPTTILAWQHYQTLMSRMNGYPVRIGLLNRFVNPKKQKQTLEHLEKGDVDVIVGTHRLIQKDVKFKDLGLVIIDEEQRFGVEQKEVLKEAFKNVDVLTLSATPIPRTLNMAMSGIRDMSVLDEAPGDRYPVQSYVCEFDEGIVFDAVSRELSRGGQVFYLVNKVSALRTVAAKLQNQFPEASVAFAHGNMNEDGLSRIWQALVSGEIDILVCTTIIETGIDVPNANTLIIENAERMGLSQLHQLRGRVGRSSRRAYAYFTYPQGKTLDEIQTKRLTAIRDYTEFGAGFKIAMRDLEIRGAGNILGPEQHGQIAAVGYDLYIKILDEAVRELKIKVGDEKTEKTSTFREVTLDLPISSYIPGDYIYSERMRIDVYRKISAVSSREEVSAMIDELCDRFSDIPKEVMNLIGMAYVRSLAIKAGIEAVRVNGGNVVIFPYEFKTELWGRLATEDGYHGKVMLSPSGIPHITYRMAPGDKKDYIKILDGIFTKIVGYINE